MLYEGRGGKGICKHFRLKAICFLSTIYMKYFFIVSLFHLANSASSFQFLSKWWALSSRSKSREWEKDFFFQSTPAKPTNATTAVRQNPLRQRWRLERARGGGGREQKSDVFLAATFFFFFSLFLSDGWQAPFKITNLINVAA